MILRTCLLVKQSGFVEFVIKIYDAKSSTLNDYFSSERLYCFTDLRNNTYCFDDS